MNECFKYADQTPGINAAAAIFSDEHAESVRLCVSAVSLVLHAESPIAPPRPLETSRLQ